MEKVNLFEIGKVLVEENNISPKSTAYRMIKEGNKKHTSLELAKALKSTKAFTKVPDLKKAVEEVIFESSEEEKELSKTVKEKKTRTNKYGEPCR